MPDITRKTLSATQIPALFGYSPYVTEWMLYHWALDKLDLDDVKVNERMEFGELMEPVILTMAARKLRLDVKHHEAQTYCVAVDGRYGCTIDADCADPQKGPGIVEAKEVDYKVWMESWTDSIAPPHIEIQLQVQMMVKKATWGVIAARVCSKGLTLYRRTPNIEMQAQILKLVAGFWERVKNRRPPSIVGTEREIKGLSKLYPEHRESKVVEAGDDIYEMYEDLVAAQEAAKDAKELIGSYSAKLWDAAGDAMFVRTPSHTMKFKKTCTKAGTIRKAPIKAWENS